MDGGREGGSGRGVAIRVGQLALTVLVTWFIVDRVGVTAEDVLELGDRWLSPDWGGLLLASAVLLGGFFLSAVLWGRMVLELGGPRLGAFRATGIYFAANLGRYVPGKVWQLAGLAYLAGRSGVDAGVATAAAVLLQALSLAGATVVGAWALAGGDVVGGWGTWLAVLLLAAVAVATLRPVFRRLLSLWLRLADRARALRSSGAGHEAGASPTPGEVRVPTSGQGSAPSAATARAPSPDPAALERAGPAFGLRWTLFFAGNWVVYAGAFWLMALSFGVEASFLDVGPAFAAAYVLGYAMIFAPAGIGVREGFLIAFLQPTTGAAVATGTAVVARFWMTVMEVLPAAVLGGAQLLGRGRRDGRAGHGG